MQLYLNDYFNNVSGKTIRIDSDTGDIEFFYNGDWKLAGVNTTIVDEKIAEHNTSVDAHEGRLLPITNVAGMMPIYDGEAWGARYGIQNVTIEGSFTGQSGCVYILNLEEENKVVYVDAVASDEDYEFYLMVAQGTPVHELTIIGDHHPVLWSDNEVPPSYLAENPPPAMANENAAYIIKFHWNADLRVLFAEMIGSTDAMRGVFLTSGGVFIESAMTVSGGTIGTDYLADRMDVHNRGIAIEQTIVDGGEMYVSAGGIANTTVVSSAGKMFIRPEGFVSGLLIESGAEAEVERGWVEQAVVNGSYVITSDSTIKTTIVNGGGVMTVSHSEIFGATVDGGSLSFVGSCIIEDVAFGSSGGNISLAGPDNTISGLTVTSGAVLTVSSGGVATSAVVMSGGRMNVSSGGIWQDGLLHGVCFVYGVGVVRGTQIKTGGYINVSAGTVSGVSVDPGAAIYISSGGLVNAEYSGLGYVYSGAVDSVSVINAGGILLVSGGITFDTTVFSGGSAIVSSGGIASHFTSVDGAKVVISSGGSATINGMAYGVSVSSGGKFIVESDGVANDMVVLLGGTVHVSSGGMASNSEMTGAGRIEVFNGGVIDGVSTSAGFVVVNSDGFVKNAAVRAGYLIASNGGVASGTVISVYTTAGSGLVRGGIFDSTTVSNGGQLHVSSGTAINTTVENGGKMYVSSGGSVDVAIVESGGLMTISSGGVAQNTTVAGYVYVSGGVMSGGTVASVTDGGFARIYTYSGAEATGLVASRAGQIIMSGGTAFSPVINSSGFLTVSSGAVALDVTSSAGAIVTVLEGGTITYKE